MPVLRMPLLIYTLLNISRSQFSIANEVLVHCIKKFRVTGSGEDHALLLPPGINRPGKWLSLDRTLEQNDIQTNVFENNSHLSVISNVFFLRMYWNSEKSMPS